MTFPIRSPLTIALALFIGSFFPHSMPLFAQQPESFSGSRLLMKFRPSSLDADNLPDLRKISQALEESLLEIEMKEMRPLSRLGFRGPCVLEFQNELNVDGAVKAFIQSGLFEYVEPDYTGQGSGRMVPLLQIPNDTYFGRQYGLYNDGTFGWSTSVAGADISMEEAWEITQGDQSVTIAILDSGLKLDHPEFAGRIWQNSNEVENGLDSDANGFSDDMLGWDFVNNDNNPTDDHGHGTNVTGIMGATGNNGIGYAGVDWSCRIMPLKIINSENYGYYSWWSEAIYYAVDQGVDAINMSLGGYSYSSTLHQAIQYAYTNNVAVVASMMNNNDAVPLYPAAFLETIAVGATDAEDNRVNPFFWSETSGSSFGEHIDLVAPGNYIFGLSAFSDTDYDSYWGGTSQAAPLVTGVIALMKGMSPELNVEQIREILQNTSEDEVGNPSEDTIGFDIYYGHGRLNCQNALTAIASIAGCTYSSALNYNAEASTDDGTCLFEVCNNDCPFDVNEDGSVGASDLLDFLVVFGQSCL